MRNKKSNIYGHLKRIKEGYDFGVVKKHAYDPINPVLHRVLILPEVMHGFARYEELVRKLAALMGVIVLRPESHINYLYVTGKDLLVSAFITTFTTMITYVEEATTLVRHTKLTKEKHLAEVKSDFRDDCVRMYYDNIRVLVDALVEPLELRLYKYLLKQYINETNSFKTLKPYKW